METDTLLEALRQSRNNSIFGGCMTPNRSPLRELSERPRNTFTLFLSFGMKSAGEYQIRRKGELDKQRGDISVSHTVKGILRIGKNTLAAITIRFDSVSYCGTYTIELPNKRMKIQEA